MITKYSDQIKVSYHRFDFFDDSCKDCGGGEKILYINNEGRISPCFWISSIFPEFLTERNIFEEEFLELKNDIAIRNFMKKEKKRYGVFGPGCPAMCTISNDMFHSKDPLKTVTINT